MDPTGSGSQPLSCDRGPPDVLPDLETSLWAKSEEQNSLCSATPDQTGPVYSTQPGNHESGREERPISRNLTSSNIQSQEGSSAKKENKVEADPSHCPKDPFSFQGPRKLRLKPFKPNQLIKGPSLNQPVVVLNHPDVDPPEVKNMMKFIHVFKDSVLKVDLSEQTLCQLGVPRQRRRLTCLNVAKAQPEKRQATLKIKLKRVHKNIYQVVDSQPDNAGAAAQ